MSSNQKLYYPIESIRNTFSKVSTTSFYKVAFPISGGLQEWLTKTGLYKLSNSDGLDAIESIELLCSGAVLPGTNLKVTETLGNRQGVLEKYPIFKQYPDLALTFYVDANHKVIKFFEEWTNYISPLYSTTEGQVSVSDVGVNSKYAKNESSYFKFRYPNDYTQTIYVTKFEKNLNALQKDSGKETYSYKNSSLLTYEFVKAYPNNIVASAVSYEGSNILTFTVTFTYSRYYVNTAQPSSSGGSIVIPDVQVLSTVPELGLNSTNTSTTTTGALNINGVDQIFGTTSGFDSNIA